MADIDTLIAELRAGLEGTTQGEWTRRDTPDYAEMIAPDQKQPLALVGRAEDADYIALASPQNIRALLDHIERLKYDLDLAKEQSLLNYNDATGLAMKLGTAEAELARLRKPVTEGEVKGVVRSLSLIACAPRCEHASECNCTVLDNAADLIQRLAGQVAEAQQDRCVPTCHEIADKAFAARDAAETRLRDAVEVINGLNALIAKGQKIITDTLIGQPRGLSDKAGLSALIGLLDGPEQRAAQEAAKTFLSTLKDQSNGNQ